MKLSIITVNLNNLEGLKKTFQSVVTQTFKDFEYIIIDGGSTDGSKEFLEENSIKITYWQSKKDKGIYDAMNQGILKANGEYLLFLNSGDFLYSDDTLIKIIPELLSDLIYGNLIFSGNSENFVFTPPQKLDFHFFYKKSLPHPATFIKRNILLNYNLYSLNMKICSDWAFFIDAICLMKCSYKHIDEYISIFNTDGISSLFESGSIIQKEKEIHFNNNYKEFISYYISTEIELAKFRNLKNSRLRKFLSFFFKQLRIH